MRRVTSNFRKVWFMQGLLQLFEPSATVYARSKDEAIMRRSLGGAKKTHMYRRHSQETILILAAELTESAPFFHHMSGGNCVDGSGVADDSEGESVCTHTLSSLTVRL